MQCRARSRSRSRAAQGAHLSGVEVDEAVAPRLPLHRPRLVEQEVKLLHVAKLLQQLHKVVPAGWEKHSGGSAEQEQQQNNFTYTRLYFKSPRQGFLRVVGM